jgi:hypothetical protein
MKDFLNRYMAVNRNLQKQTEAQLRSVFELTVSTIFRAIGIQAFRPKAAVNAAVLDSVMVYMQRIIGHHTTPREAGLVFAQTKPKLAAYTHIALLGSERIPPPTIDDVVAETRTTYRGPLAFGEDLMAFEIGETVLVRRLEPFATGSASAA